jgi:hypothetical protein
MAWLEGGILRALASKLGVERGTRPTSGLNGSSDPLAGLAGLVRSAFAFSLRFAQGERGAERLVPALRSATGEPGTRDGSPFGGPLSAALGS